MLQSLAGAEEDDCTENAILTRSLLFSLMNAQAAMFLIGGFR